MTTPARRADAEEASTAFHLALAAIGAETAADALAYWQEVPASEAAAVAERWLEEAVRLVLFRRRQSRALALSYYRLVRALRTGYTIGSPLESDPPEVVTLATLRAEFAALVADVLERDPGDISGEGDDEEIPVENIDGLSEELEADEAEAEADARTNLKMLGSDNLVQKLSNVESGERPAQDVDSDRETAHEEAGTRQAASAARMAMNGARSTVWQAATRDSRVIGWVRVSLTGTPCGFCGMLISRGLVLRYGSRQSAEFTEDGDLFHDNCMCYAEPVFSQDQYTNSDRFDLNRDLQKLWEDEIAGKYSGNDALNAFRTLLKKRFKAQAQEATGDPTTTQEA